MIFHINRSGKFMRQLKDNELRALHEVGKFLVKKMNYYVPVDTGYLRSRNEYVINRNELFIQNDCHYAKFQEYGTYKMRAQPFMRPAYQKHGKEIQQIFKTEMARGI